MEYNNIQTKKQTNRDWQIGDWNLPHGEILAPMAGITDSPYRRIARQFGAGLLYTECISAEGTRRMKQGSLDLARFSPEERPLAVQLFGATPDTIAEAASVIAESLSPDIIDINCGCPVKKFVTRKCGGYLMQYPDLIGRMVAEVRSSTGLPVSVKLRIGYRQPDETAPLAAIAAVEAGAAIVAVHGRYVRGAKGTSADWSAIARVRKAVPDVPVFGNGDVTSYEDARKMITQTGVDRVMVGRWAEGRPWIFAGLAGQSIDDDGQADPPFKERIDILLQHYRLMLEYLPERRAVHRMRKHIGWYTVGMPGSAKLRGRLMTVDDPRIVLDSLQEFGLQMQTPLPENKPTAPTS